MQICWSFDRHTDETVTLSELVPKNKHLDSKMKVDIITFHWRNLREFY